MARTAEEIDLAPFIDHSLLSSVATPAHVEQWCEEADRFGFAAVCVYPIYVKQAVLLLHRKSPRVCTVIGFPSGATTAAVKLFEAQEALENGAQELDVVINLGALKVGETDAVHRELAEIVEATGLTVKAILETGLLTEAEKSWRLRSVWMLEWRFLKPAPVGMAEQPWQMCDRLRNGQTTALG